MTVEQPVQASLARRLRKRVRRVISVGEDIGYRPVVAETGLLLFIVFVFVGAGASAATTMCMGAEAVVGWQSSLPLAVAALAQIFYGRSVFQSRGYTQAHLCSWGRWCVLFLYGAVSLVIVLPVLMGAASLVESIRAAWGLPPTPEVAHTTLVRLQESGIGAESILIFLNAGLLVPFAEEIGWRGMLLPSLRRARFTPLAANLVTSVLFAAVHLPALTDEAVMQSVLLLVMLSLTLGWLRARTGSLAASIGLHAAFNAFNLIAVAAG